MTEADRPHPNAARQRWLATLAHAPRAELLQAAEHWAQAAFETLRTPETGLAMVRARIANQGDRYNLGEATLTRCVVRHTDPASGHVSVGVGYVLGRDAERALAVARLDALLQQPGHQAVLLRDAIAPLQARTAAQRAAEQSRTAASRVRFYTLQPEVGA